jgi:anti-anti-sigma factor
MKMKDISIRLKEHGKKDERRAEVIIEGEFSIGFAERVKEKLLEVMEQYDKIDVKVQNLENLDLSAIQLLVSLRKSLPTDKFKLILVLREDLKPIIEHAGLHDILLN